MICTLTSDSQAQKTWTMLRDGCGFLLPCSNRRSRTSQTQKNKKKNTLQWLKAIVFEKNYLYATCSKLAPCATSILFFLKMIKWANSKVISATVCQEVGETQLTLKSLFKIFTLKRREKTTSLRRQTWQAEHQCSVPKSRLLTPIDDPKLFARF